ncbi:tetratricopeptide repeat protein [Treponema sp.]|uniref:tetratricopeptide repeat protein n=1 Tax=Treponema sp. TaxID=166 RepID=UPI00388E1D4C
MAPANEYFGRDYAKEIPVAEYGSISEAEALKMYIEIAETQKSPDAAYAVCCYIRSCYNINHHYKIAFEGFIKLHKEGYIPATHSLAYLYAKGYGTEKNIEEAIRLYKIAGEAGFANSYKNLGILFLEGEEVSKDLGAGISYIEKVSSLSNSPESKSFLGDTYIDYFDSQDYIKKGEQLLLEAEHLGDNDAVYSLAALYDKTGKLPNDRKETYYFKKMMELKAQEKIKYRETKCKLLPYLLEQEKRGDTSCLDHIANIYNPYSAICPDYEQFYEYKLKAAENGHYTAMGCVAAAYAQGNHFEMNKEKALYWYKKLYKEYTEDRMITYHLVNFYAAAIPGAGNYMSEKISGLYLGAGHWEDYSKIDKEEAVAFFKEIADKKDLPKWNKKEQEKARLLLGFCYAKGIGTEKNLELAYQYDYTEIDKHIETAEEVEENRRTYREERSAKEKELRSNIRRKPIDGEVYFNLAHFYMEFSNKENCKKALPYLIQAKELNYIPALAYLASIYKEGRYVKYDFEKAAQYYLLAAAKGNTNAISQVRRLYQNGIGVAPDMNADLAWALKQDPKYVFDRDIERYLLDSEIPAEFRKSAPSSDWWNADTEEEEDFDYTIDFESESYASEEFDDPTEVLYSFWTLFINDDDRWHNYIYLDPDDDEDEQTERIEKFNGFHEKLIESCTYFSVSFNKIKIKDKLDSDKYFEVKVYFVLEVEEGIEKDTDELSMFYSKDKNRWYVDELPN